MRKKAIILFYFLATSVILAQEIPYDSRLIKYPIRPTYQEHLVKVAIPSDDPIVYGRNIEDHPVHTVYWIWDELNKKWEKSHQEWLIYNPDQLLINMLDQSWDGSKWKDETRTVYVYNDDHSLRMFQFESWEEGTWQLYSRFLYSYSADGDLLSFTAQDWSDDKWSNRYRKVNVIDEAYHCTTTTTQYWLDEKWANYYRDTEVFNSSGGTQTKTHEVWDQSTWCFIDRKQFEYADPSRCSSVLGQLWDKYEWKDESMTSYTYNPSGNVTIEKVHRLNSSPWYQDFAWVYTYDDQEHLMQSSFWSIENEVWQMQSQDANTFDALGRIVTTLSQQFTDYWVNKEFIQNEYATSTGVQKLDISDHLRIYPNPVLDNLCLEISNWEPGPVAYSIHTLDGKLIFENKIQFTDQMIIPVSTLPMGSYLLTVSGGNIFGEKIFIKN